MTNNKKLKIIHVASEVDPFSKTGGLADVIRSLPKAQKRLGHEVAIITPLYKRVVDIKKHGLKMIEKDIKVQINSQDIVKVNFYKGYLMPGLPVYFIENTKYFSKRKTLYGSTHENARFMVFDVACLRLLAMLDFKPNIIHCHDWHTGLIPYYLRTNFHYAKKLKKAKTVYTIHNLAFQMGQNWWNVPLKYKDYGTSKLPRLGEKKIEYINFAKRAILTADVINTVSERYAEEILTKKFGQDLHHILKNRRHKLFGIINGIDYRAYNPYTDPGLRKKYNTNTVSLKKINKNHLQKKFNLAINTNVPIITMTSRIAFQKGFSLFNKILDKILRLNVQIIVMGDGSKEYVSTLKKYQRKFPKKIIWIPFDKKVETSMYAGGDFFLLPSQYEPCGLNQMVAMRYGCIPIVHYVGGLFDTVNDYDTATNSGNGFVFKNFDSYELYGAIIRALEIYKNKKRWRALLIRAMRESNSWELPAKKYIDLYRRAN